MCPSFMVTREEKHTTRGRAHLLFEMLEGAPVDGMWQDDEVFEALDLCLACKGCTNDCPVHVDMATLKAEFLAHYYEKRLRPRHAYAFGLIDQVARVASLAPGLVNVVTQTPGLARFAKAAAGMAPDREFPTFAPQTLQDWFRRAAARAIRAARPCSSGRTRSTTTSTPRSASRPSSRSRPPATASSSRRDTSAAAGRSTTTASWTWRAATSKGRSTASARRSAPARRSSASSRAARPSSRTSSGRCSPATRMESASPSRSSTSASFSRREGYEPPTLPRKVLLHGHCHHKATGGIGSEQKLLEKMGAEIEAPGLGLLRTGRLVGLRGGPLRRVDGGRRTGASSGCARRLHDTLLVADGFSCRTQIEHGARRKPLHLAQVLSLAQGREIPEQPRDGGSGGKLLLGALLAGGAVYAAKRAWPT